jgi:hypothetical protein
MIVLVLVCVVIVALIAHQSFRYERVLMYISHYHGDELDAREHEDLAYAVRHTHGSVEKLIRSAQANTVASAWRDTLIGVKSR